MKHVYDLTDAMPGATCVTFGCFDGMHIGHRAVIQKLKDCEAQTPVVVSFREEEAPVIYSESEKEYLLSQMGVQTMVSMDRKLIRTMTADAFVRDILVEKLRAGTVVAGENLCFGSDQKGVADLKALGAELGFAVEVVPTVCHEGNPVCTDHIMEAVAAGDFSRMSALLGGTYIMRGAVVHGKAAGRKHGMPTANLAVAQNKRFPPHGVYATLSHLDGSSFRGVTNIGLRPSDDDIPIATIETWLLNFSRDIYGEHITLELYTYIRGVMKFANLDEVRKQIDQDARQAQQFFDDLAKNNG